MTISREKVRQISQLARISLNEDELDQFRDDMNQILNWMRQLEEVNTESVPPFSDMGGNLFERARDDIAEPAPAREQLLANAPQITDGFYTVPRVLE